MLVIVNTAVFLTKKSMQISYEKTQATYQTTNKYIEG
jgi:hypothetical protein